MTTEIRINNVSNHAGKTDNDLRVLILKAVDIGETAGIVRIRLAGFGGRLEGREMDENGILLPQGTGKHSSHSTMQK